MRQLPFTPQVQLTSAPLLNTAAAGPPKQIKRFTEVSNPIRKIGFYASLGFMFFRFSEAHQLLNMVLGINTFPLYIFGIPAIIGLILSGGVRRAFSMKCGWYWLGYLVWLVMCIPFSFWPGGSFGVVLSYVRTQWLTFFLIAGLVMTWRECWILINMLAVAGVVAVGTGKFFVTTSANSRIELTAGTYANANDYAALLILMVPFLALVMFTPRRNVLWRAGALFTLLYGGYLILATGSRGGLVGVIAAGLFVLVKLSMRARIMALAGFTVGGLFLVSVTSDTIVTRLTTVFSNADGGASESAQIRSQLFRFAVMDTITHPVFGVGPGQFGDFTGSQTRHTEGGNPGLWFQTHNTYLQVSAECGLPAFFFFAAALLSTLRLLSRIYAGTKRRVGESEELKKLNLSALCMLASFIGFGSAVFFLSFAYHFHLPAMTGIAMVMAQVAEHEFGIPVLRAGRVPAARPR